MIVQFIYCGEIAAEVKDWPGPAPQVGYKVVLEDGDYDKYEVIRCTIDVRKPNILICHIDNI